METPPTANGFPLPQAASREKKGLCVSSERSAETGAAKRVEEIKSSAFQGEHPVSNPFFIWH